MSVCSSGVRLKSISSRIGAMNIRNIIWESGEPYGTPTFVLPLPLVAPSHSMLNSLSLKRFFTQSFHLLPCSLFSILWSTSVVRCMFHKAQQEDRRTALIELAKPTKHMTVVMTA